MTLREQDCRVGRNLREVRYFGDGVSLPLPDCSAMECSAINSCRAVRSRDGHATDGIAPSNNTNSLGGADLCFCSSLFACALED